jgi:predicted neutral ceramidase superfamily lipid hydrolase
MQEQWGPDLPAVVNVIQTALTPAFLLVALGSLLNVLTGRLSRVIDRSRDLQIHHSEYQGEALVRVVTEQRILAQRIKVIGRSILLAVLSAVVVCIMIGLLFLMGLTRFSEPLLIVAAFILSLALLAWSLAAFIREIALATDAIKVPEEYLMLPETSEAS